MNKKQLISLTIGFTFLAISISGVLLFIKQKAHAVEITHTLFGLIFVGFAIFHIRNNWGSITSYSKSKKENKYTKELMVAGSIFGLILVGGVTEVLEPVAEFGRIFAPKRPPKAELYAFEKIKLGTESNLKIFVEKDDEEAIVSIVEKDGTAVFSPSKSVKSTEKEPLQRQIEQDEAKIETVDSQVLGTPKGNYDLYTPLKNFLVETNNAKAKVDILVYVNGKMSGSGSIEKGKGMQSCLLSDNSTVKKVFFEF